jgi:hypothetical protein
MVRDKPTRERRKSQDRFHSPKPRPSAAVRQRYHGECGDVLPDREAGNWGLGRLLHVAEEVMLAVEHPLDLDAKLSSKLIETALAIC